MPDNDSSPGAQPSLSELFSFLEKADLQLDPNGEWKTTCPMAKHQHDYRDPRFFISDIKNPKEGGLYYCHKCRTGGTGIELVTNVLKRESWESAVEEYRKNAPISANTREEHEPTGVANGKPQKNNPNAGPTRLSIAAGSWCV